jgi:hypothetical protein
MATLYIVDGESSGGSLRGLLPKEKILVWRDALYDGPVPGGLSLAQLSRVRTRHWGAGNELSIRDRELARFRKFEEIVLWFGPTMVCQLSLIQVLDWFAGQEKGDTTVSLIDGEYAGWIPPKKLAPYLERRRPVTAAIYRLARRVWKAFTARDPRKLNAILSADLTVLPELHRVLLLQAQEYPDSRNGLSRIERKLLDGLTEPAGVAHLVVSVMTDETFGDTYYFDILRRFLRSRNQLIYFAEPFHGNVADHQFNRSRIALSDFGRMVLNNQADAIAFNSIDRWIGGVHLEGHQCPWRWSDTEQRIICAPLYDGSYRLRRSL